MQNIFFIFSMICRGCMSTMLRTVVSSVVLLVHWRTVFFCLFNISQMIVKPHTLRQYLPNNTILPCSRDQVSGKKICLVWTLPFLHYCPNAIVGHNKVKPPRTSRYLWERVKMKLSGYRLIAVAEVINSFLRDEFSGSLIFRVRKLRAWVLFIFPSSKEKKTRETVNIIRMTGKRNGHS